MEIRDPVHGAIELTPPESEVVEHAFFQRLRNIKQMGFAEFAFPGATHNRYSHSIGAMHLAGRVFDQIFHGKPFSTKEVKWRLRQAVRLGALLHDIGHGPLSHTTEEVMPPVSELNLPPNVRVATNERKANHEDFTLKIVTDSSLTPVLKKEFPDLSPEHVAQVVNTALPITDDFFVDNRINYRPLLGQIVSSELDVDRMDYLARDSYFCGTSYGHVDREWLIANLTLHVEKQNAYLALNRRALYTFDDFLISRLHMFLQVYFHHKGIIYDEMLLKYLKSSECNFFLPSNIEEYLNYDDHMLHAHLAQSTHPFAKMISQHKPMRLFFESHEKETRDTEKVLQALKNEGIDFIHTSSTGKLSKYYTGSIHHNDIFVIEENQITPRRVTRIEEATEIFRKYEGARKISRIYVSQLDYNRVLEIFKS